MTDERLIEARQALDILHRYSFGFNEIGREQVATLVEVASDALAVFEKAHTPTDDEREGLNTLYWTHPDVHTTGLSPDAIDAILAAGFRRSEVNS